MYCGWAMLLFYNVFREERIQDVVNDKCIHNSVFIYSFHDSFPFLFVIFSLICVFTIHPLSMVLTKAVDAGCIKIV